MLQVDTGERQLLYSHSSVTELVSASVNHECTLLGFTQMTRHSLEHDASPSDVMYESFLVEVSAIVGSQFFLFRTMQAAVHH